MPSVYESNAILAFFSYAHLPPHLAKVSEKFATLAVSLCETLPPGAERTVALRKLLESKDAAVRATVGPTILRENVPGWATRDPYSTESPHD